MDEKSAIQALDRMDPVLPLPPGRAERHGFEYYRHGTLSLYAAREFLEAYPHVRLHFAATYSFWLNQVEIWFAKIERDVIALGVFTSVPDLARKLRRYINAYSANAQPIRWKYSTAVKTTESKVLPYMFPASFQKAMECGHKLWKSMVGAIGLEPMTSRVSPGDLLHPLLIRVPGDAGNLDASALQMQEEQHLGGYQAAPPQDLHGKEISACQDIHVSRQEVLPRVEALIVRMARENTGWGYVILRHSNQESYRKEKENAGSGCEFEYLAPQVKQRLFHGRETLAK